ncbi:putative transposase [Arthrobacter sp. UYEF3]|uniref:putative transposase n=1 Tax=Arthrobacter sp. UYEF3 TaxID=1756365 RepID=UPI00339A3B8D
MTAQLPLPVPMIGGAALVGLAVSLVEGGEGGRVFIHGELAYAWDARDTVTRRFTAVKLAEIKAASVAEIAGAFGIEPVTLWRWRQLLAAEGVAGLAPERMGPKGPSRLTGTVMAEIVALRASGLSLRAVGAAVGVSEFSVRRALRLKAGDGNEPGTPEPAGTVGTISVTVAQPVLPVLPAPVDRSGERAAARAGLLECAAPAFAPAARVPLAGLFLALPALETTGLLACSRATFGALPDGFYGLDSLLLDAVFRALAGEPRAEGATRLDPEALGRVLGLDRAPEVKTIRRKLTHLAGTGKAAELITAMAIKHLGTSTGAGGSGEDGLAAVLYVDGHVRAYQGRKKIGKVHSTRLKFPVPATEETWVADAAGAPVLVVLAEPGAALTGELRRLLPSLRTIVGDDRRVLVGFDRGGWSPALFKHMSGAGFDVLTWRKGATTDIDEHLFNTAAHTVGHGKARSWTAADTLVDLPLGGTGEVFQMRQISRIVPTRGGGSRQIHILTTTESLPAGELIYRMGSRWRQENYFRYARMHFALDSHDAYASTDDDAERSVPNPAKKKAYQQVLAARARHAQAKAETDAALLAARTPLPGSNEVTVTSAAHNTATAPLWDAETALEAAEASHQGIPARVRLGDLAPGQQVLDTETKLLSHAVRMAAFNTATTLDREARTNTGYARAAEEAHTLVRQALTGSGDIDPTQPGYLTIRLDPFPTQRATAAIAELYQHLTNTQTRYPGTDLVLRYEVKNRKPSLTE